MNAYDLNHPEETYGHPGQLHGGAGGTPTGLPTPMHPGVRPLPSDPFQRASGMVPRPPMPIVPGGLGATGAQQISPTAEMHRLAAALRQLRVGGAGAGR